MPSRMSRARPASRHVAIAFTALLALAWAAGARAQEPRPTAAIRWNEYLATEQSFLIPADVQQDGDVDRHSFTLDHVENALSWSCECTPGAGPADGTARLVLLGHREFASSEAGTELEDRSVDLGGSRVEFTGKGGTWSATAWDGDGALDAGTRASLERSFRIATPADLDLLPESAIVPEDGLRLEGPRVLSLYRMDLGRERPPVLAEATLRPISTTAEETTCAVTFRVEFETDGRRLVRSGVGHVTYDRTRRIVRNYQFTGEVLLTQNVEGKPRETRGTWTSRGARTFAR